MKRPTRRTILKMLLLLAAGAAVNVAVAWGLAMAPPAYGPYKRVVTNFVLFRLDRDRGAFLDALAARGVQMVAYSHGQVRAATHHDVTDADIDTVIQAARAALADTASLARPRRSPERVGASA